MSTRADTLARGWCPSVRRPMESGDGLIVRLHPKNGALTPAQAAGVAEAAEQFGNGILDLTSHANLQIRGVTEETQDALETALCALDLVEASPRPPFRATVISPLAGLDPDEVIDGRDLADLIEAAVHETALPPKFLVAIETGGRGSLDRLSPDVRLVTLDRDRLTIGLAQEAGMVWSAPIAIMEFEEGVRRLLAGLATALSDHGARRVRELPRAAVDALLPEAGEPPTLPPVPQVVAGMIALKDGLFGAMAASPFGQVPAAALGDVARLAEAHSLAEIRLTPGRGLLLGPLDRDDADACIEAFARIGLVTSSSDPLLCVVTCPGGPACSRGETSTHDDARELVARLPPGAWPASLHLSGCRKGCARRRASDLTLVATGTGFDVVLDGGPLDAPVAHLDFDVILHGLAAAEDRADFVQAISGGRAHRCATTT